MVVNAGLQEFRAHQVSTEISGDIVDASKRALQRATAIKIAEFRRGLSGLATIGSTAPFVGLFGTVFGIINAFVGMGESANAGISAVAGGIAEARHHSGRSRSGRARSLVVQLLHQQGGQLHS